MSNLFTKIRTILSAWAEQYNPTPEAQARAEERLKVCMGCEHWREAAVNYCAKCGCATRSKIYTPPNLEGCPEKKWDR